MLNLSCLCAQVVCQTRSTQPSVAGGQLLVQRSDRETSNVMTLPFPGA